MDHEMIVKSPVFLPELWHRKKADFPASVLSHPFQVALHMSIRSPFHILFRVIAR